MTSECWTLVFNVTPIVGNALVGPASHVQYCPPDHCRVKVRHLASQVGLKGSQVCWPRCVNLHNGMGWDKISVLVSPPLKNLLQGPPPSLHSITATLVSRVIPRSKFPHSLMCTDEFTQTGATYYITIFGFREGSCLNPRKEKAARFHGRKKLLQSTEGEICSSPRKEKDARTHRRKKLLESTEGGSDLNPQTD